MAKSETLSQKQRRFVQMVTQLLVFIDSLEEYEVTFGETWRHPDAKHGNKKSLHHDRLAIDLNLFINGRYVTKTEHHAPLGEFWKSIGGSWGGDFGDGNHYSLAHKGLK